VEFTPSPFSIIRLFPLLLVNVTKSGTLHLASLLYSPQPGDNSCFTIF